MRRGLPEWPDDGNPTRPLGEICCVKSLITIFLSAIGMVPDPVASSPHWVRMWRGRTAGEARFHDRIESQHRRACERNRRERFENGEAAPSAGCNV